MESAMAFRETSAPWIFLHPRQLGPELQAHAICLFDGVVRPEEVHLALVLQAGMIATRREPYDSGGQPILIPGAPIVVGFGSRHDAKVLAPVVEHVPVDVVAHPGIPEIETEDPAVKYVFPGEHVPSVIYVQPPI